MLSRFTLLNLSLVGILFSCGKESPKPTSIQGTHASVSTQSRYTSSTFVGTGTAGFFDGGAHQAAFNSLYKITSDANGYLYVTDGNRIRKITPSGIVSTFAGNRTAGHVDGTGSDAQFNSLSGIAVDASGNVYVSDALNHRIRKITVAGVVTTVAGSSSGYHDAIGTEARFNYPSGLVLDVAGNIYVTDQNNHRVRKITPAGVVSTFVGSTEGFTDGTGTEAKFGPLNSIGIDISGNFYVPDIRNYSIRKITPAGVVTTIAGNGERGETDGTGADARFDTPCGVAIDATGNVYVAEPWIYRIRKITPSGVVTTVAGSTQGYQEGTGSTIEFATPFDLTLVNNRYLYVADQGNYCIRKITIE